MKHATEGMLAFMSTDFKASFVSKVQHICNTDGKVNMLANPMVEYMNGNIDAEQLENRLYRALVMCFDERRKFNDVELNYTVVSTTNEHVENLMNIIAKVITKFRNDYLS